MTLAEESWHLNVTLWICGVYVSPCPLRQKAETGGVKVNVAFPEHAYCKQTNIELRHVSPIRQTDGCCAELGLKLSCTTFVLHV